MKRTLGNKYGFYGVQVVYNMTRKVRGRVIIVSNQYFTTRRHRSRVGAEFDVQNVSSLFSQLGFEPVVLRDARKTVS